MVQNTVQAALRRQIAIRTHFQQRGGLTSVLSYPDRGPWGQSRYHGNCSGYLIVDLIDAYNPRTVFDPMEGSSTTGDVCADFGIPYEGRALRAGWDLLSSPLPERLFDLIFLHPPYWPGRPSTTHPNDFARAKTATDYLERLREGFTRLMSVLEPHGHLVMLIGDGRKNSTFYPIHTEIITWNLLPLEAILIKDGKLHERRARHFRYGPTPFIPMLHEYVLLFRGKKP